MIGSGHIKRSPSHPTSTTPADKLTLTDSFDYLTRVDHNPELIGTRFSPPLQDLAVFPVEILANHLTSPATW
ncbi:hypothetical protein PCASD_17026 [Puccinia coronata f. sp. avenae]|uniref:Uncharacterized protein n=1 Tax=Puccinia coronata f. sp. avenae TaxID=200324 RepID=A0A2N5SPX7_9BASI|nr:hypothetical protein PCASD_17026 [Puccinia coronata f. sp. avenae]